MEILGVFNGAWPQATLSSMNSRKIAYKKSASLSIMQVIGQCRRISSEFTPIVVRDLLVSLVLCPTNIARVLVLNKNLGLFGWAHALLVLHRLALADRHPRGAAAVQLVYGRPVVD